MGVAITLHHSNCVAWLVDYHQKHLADQEAYPLFDAGICDPPYHLTSIVKRFGGANAAEAKVGATGAYARAAKGFMGKAWDGGDIAFRPETWRAVYDALKPGAHLVAFSGCRTYHRMACAIEDAGFEIREMLAWTFGQGFPKSHDVSKGIDRAAGAEREVVGRGSSGKSSLMGGLANRDGEYGHALTNAATPEAAQWQGWGTALKPALEPICLARKPLSEKSIAANVLKHGTGALNIDATRIGISATDPESFMRGERQIHAKRPASASNSVSLPPMTYDAPKGRWPANLIHDGSDEVLAGFPDTTTGNFSQRGQSSNTNQPGGWNTGERIDKDFSGDSGSAARFFYSAKAGPLDRIGTAHATVKPVDVMRWLCRLVTPPGGHILEPFAGSGTTGIAAMAEGFDCTMIELEADHVADIERKLAYLRGEGAHTIAEHNHAKNLRTALQPLGGLFGGAS